jgi:hypothetical protein
MIRRLAKACRFAALTLALAGAAFAQSPGPGAAPSRALDRPVAAQPLDWTAQPGAFEASLRRRYGNPLYAPSRRRVGRDELRSAVIRDAAEAREALAEFMNLALQHRKLARLEDAGEIDAAVARFGKQIRVARGIGGEASKLADELQRIRSQLLASWRERNADSPEVQRELDEIEQSLAARAPVENSTFVAQLLRKDSPIGRADLAPALLSQDVDTIRLAMRQLDAGRRDLARRNAPAAVSYVRLEGAQIEDFDARVAALTGSRPNSGN